jgi:phenylpropionate dioxygenase-like ring-hydroxylating dioxygenase large terminal subunit
MSFILNTWYAAAWSDEVGQRLFPRTLLNEAVVFYRKSDGSVVALRDRCPHRIIPLSMGKLVGDDVECVYHGLRFDCMGRCTDNPNGNGAIPGALKVRSYPVAERWNVVWIWMGDPDLADIGQIPEFPWFTDAERYTETHGAIKLRASYLLVMDNLMDLRHTAFLHSSALEPREHARIPVKVTEENDEVWARIFSPSTTPPPFFAIVRKLTHKMDHWQEIRCNPPGAMIIFYGVTEPGKSRDEGLGTFNLNLVTPETDTTTHYFWGSARDFDLDDKALTEAVSKGSSFAFENEDRPVLEAQQLAAGNGDLMNCGPVLISNDRASVRVRRLIARRINAEGGRVDQHSSATAAERPIAPDPVALQDYV